VGVEQPPAFYDQNLERVSVPLEQSPWLAGYAVAAALLDGRRVADLGCGTGRFARLLKQRGRCEYWGVDFSPARVSEARSYVPEFDFEVGDLLDPAVQARYADFDAFAILEVLEHLERDRDLIASLPEGALVVWSVPNYDSAAHVRQFDGFTAVAERYGDLLELDPEAVSVLPRPARPSKKIFIGPAKRRAG
jgi:trans-aconitate methyltransferase